MKQLRVLVVDDSSVFRALIADGINSSGCARVIAHAGDGGDALAKMETYDPDVVTLDLEMPGKGGLETLRAIHQRRPRTVVIVVSSFTQRGAKESVRALEAGAHDVLAKPDGPDARDNQARLRASIRGLLEGLVAETSPAPAPVVAAPALRYAAPEVVAIGSSTGGPAALAAILPRLPRGFPLPILVTQHMPPLFTASLADSLDEKCQLRVSEARHGEPIIPGRAYVAPGGRHLRAAVRGGERILELTDDPPENFCRPAVDYLFRSIADAYGDRALAVILTGMGKDGTRGLIELRRRPVWVIGQSAESCAVYGMPREARLAGCVDVELPAEEIAGAILSRVTKVR